jgi:N-acetylglucosamine-6-sulfatase
VSFGRRELLVLASVVAIVGTARLTAGEDRRGGRETPRRASVERPNLLVITTDDQTLAQFSREAMPFTTRFFTRRGSTFTEAIAAPPLCCPSRAGFLTGQYPHNHGVMENDTGYPALRQKENTLPVWLDRAGYRTALIGKYLNGYPVLGGAAPPGWDEWFAVGGEVGYSDFDVGTGDGVRHLGANRYSTAVYTRAARGFVRESAARDRPFFAWLTYNAPHVVAGGVAPCAGTRAQPQTDADYRRFAGAALPPAAARVELDLADKGRWVRDKAAKRAARDAPSEVRRGPLERWRCALASLAAADRGFRSLVATLRDLGELQRTVIVFTSDNGYFYGEHGIPDGKELPYEPALRVPLATFVPPSLGDGPAPARVYPLVSNVDLAPTLLDYAGARPCKRRGLCRVVDGRSLRPLLSGRAPPWSVDRAIPIQLDDAFAYRAFRGEQTLYMELTADPSGSVPRGEIELYDLAEDPDQRENLTATDPRAYGTEARRLHARLDRLTSCAGTTGRNPCP